MKKHIIVKANKEVKGAKRSGAEYASKLGLALMKKGYDAMDLLECITDYIPSDMTIAAYEDMIKKYNIDIDLDEV